MTAVLAVDLGKSGSRATCWPAVRPAIELLDGPGSPGLASPTGPAAAEAAIGDFYRQLDRGPSLGTTLTICVGAPGALAAGQAAAELADRLCQLPGVDSAAVTSDAIIAHVGALDGQAGVCLVAGTGAVAIGLTAAGALIQVDGWGALLGDSGGGAWIGLAGLQAALREADGRGPATALRTAAMQAFGNLTDLPGLLAGQSNPSRLTARFAPAVAGLAHAGDPVAGQIVQQAAEQLAGSVIAAGRQLAGPGPVPVALTGGLLQLGAVLLDPLHAALRQADVQLDLRAPAATALDGARMLAVRHDTVAEALVHRGEHRRPDDDRRRQS